MKSVALPFGDGTVKVQLPDRAQVVKASQPNARIAPAADEAEAVRAALEQPLGMPRIGELVGPSSRVLIAFDDPTVPSYGSIRRLAVEGVLAELAADRSGALLIGRPSVLAAALIKVTGEMSRIPTRDLRRAEAFNAFFFTPALTQGKGGISLSTLFSTHPTLERRLAQLAELEAQLGQTS